MYRFIIHICTLTSFNFVPRSTRFAYDNISMTPRRLDVTENNFPSKPIDAPLSAIMSELGSVTPSAFSRLTVTNSIAFAVSMYPPEESRA